MSFADTSTTVRICVRSRRQWPVSPAADVRPRMSCESSRPRAGGAVRLVQRTQSSWYYLSHRPTATHIASLLALQYYVAASECAVAEAECTSSNVRLSNKVSGIFCKCCRLSCIHHLQSLVARNGSYTLAYIYINTVRRPRSTLVLTALYHRSYHNNTKRRIVYGSLAYRPCRLRCFNCFK